MEKLKVLVADDTLVYRKILAHAVESTGLATVEFTASNGLLAMERIRHNKLDVALLDMFMPEMDGLAVLEQIRKEHPQIAVILISGRGPDNASATVRALSLGALDFILKPEESDANKSMEKLKSQLQALFAQIKIKKLSSIKESATLTSEQTQKTLTLAPPVAKERTATSLSINQKKFNGVDLVVIASSTGGPVALEKVCQQLPANFPIPVLIVQHMPAEFTRILAQSLTRKCQLPVVEAGEGETVRPGKIMIAPGGLHMTVQPGKGASKAIKLSNSPLVNGVRPAADVLFESLAQGFKRERILAVILTGMGNDGLRGVTEMKRHCDCYCLTQSEKTCVVYGMPRSVVEAGLSDEAVDIEEIAPRINRLVSGGK
ncbi:chemotaxis-specific protein-glutamate methyltransferase CheB [Heliobacterium chlorum]|uniref:Protein-glutamate methylesterase/protein-glutamine glutaminase n=1 Tax=Heliobacterium chlorum TaxID=2698 RepID=A0ABR7SYJ6_HELCL|nr:chemotaxis-specific protein-glutamate methyltransferase CheB [Heliobacterium chlorum]MBC9783604.1 chemotaxis-specific protein-glutamate methyltransferase CheB [Heliobacterium chlorum]